MSPLSTTVYSTHVSVRAGPSERLAVRSPLRHRRRPSERRLDGHHVVVIDRRGTVHVALAEPLVEGPHTRFQASHISSLSPSSRMAQVDPASQPLTHRAVKASDQLDERITIPACAADGVVSPSTLQARAVTGRQAPCAPTRRGMISWDPLGSVATSADPPRAERRRRRDSISHPRRSCPLLPFNHARGMKTWTTPRLASRSQSRSTGRGLKAPGEPSTSVRSRCAEG
jgi:hypothetical protein